MADLQAASEPAEGPTPEVLPLPASGKHSLASWRARVTASLEKIKPVIDQGKTNIQRYRAKTLHASMLQQGDQIVVPLDFSYVEQKKAQLFFQAPDVQLQPLMPGLEDATVVFQAVVNAMVGPQEMNTKATMGEVLFDVLCPTGFGAVCIGYENVQDGVKPVLLGPAPMDPVTGTPVGPPPVDQVPNIIFERYYMDRISPARILIPHDFAGSDFDRADWLGYVFFEDVEGETANVSKASDAALEREYSLSDDGDLQQHATGKRRRCVRIYYRASKFDPAVKHPELFRELVLKDNEDQPATHRDSPYQRIAPDGSYVGMCGNPIHIFTLRYVSDSAFPPSDCTMSRMQIDEVGKGRTQMIQQRERSLPMRGADKGRVDPDTLEQLKRGKVQSIVLTDGNPNEIFAEIARAEFPRENFEFDRIAKEDASAVWALQVRGANEDAGRTATEASYKQQTTDTRLDYERTRLMDLYCAAVAKAAALKQLFATDTAYVQVVGPQGQQRLAAWNKEAIAGKYVFKVRPDSAVRLDVATERKQTLDLYNLTANDPNINRMEIGRKLTQEYGLDPGRVMQQPPPPHPEPKAASVSISGADLNPLMPQSPFCLEIVQQSGYQLSVQASQNALALAKLQAVQQQMQAAEEAQGDGGQQPHGGPAQGLEPISKHSASISGKLSGPGPM